MKDSELDPRTTRPDLALWRRLRNEARALASEQDDIDVRSELLRIASKCNLLPNAPRKSSTVSRALIESQIGPGPGEGDEVKYSSLFPSESSRAQRRSGTN